MVRTNLEMTNTVAVDILQVIIPVGLHVSVTVSESLGQFGQDPGQLAGVLESCVIKIDREFKLHDSFSVTWFQISPRTSLDTQNIST